MGNDLLLNFVYWDRDKPPRWDDARKYIESLTTEQLREHPEFEYAAFGTDDDDVACHDLKERLLRCHDQIFAYANGQDDRHTYVVGIGKYEVLITGGDSWGDSPSDMFDTIQDWGNIEGLGDFGFYPDHRGW